MMDPFELCDAMRQLTSCAIDGELSELDRFRLDRHLRDCAACTGFTRGAWALSRAVREAEPEPAFSLTLPVTVARRERRRRVASPGRRVALPARRVAAVVASVGLVLGASALGVASGIGREQAGPAIGGPSVTGQGHRLVVEAGLVGWRPAMPLGQRNALEDF